MSHIVIAKDPPTYDALVAQGEDLGLPLPIDMILDSRMRVAPPSHGAKIHALDPRGDIPASFTSCCKRSRGVTVVIVGEVPLGDKKLEPRFAVSPNQSVTVTVEENKPAPEAHVLTADVFSGALRTCRDDVSSGGEK